MANKKISELPYINGGKISGNTLVPLVTYFSATTGDTVHTYVSDLQTYLTSGITVSGDFLPLSGGTVTGQTFFTSGLTITGDTVIIDSTGTSTAIDTSTRELVDPSSFVSVDWGQRLLYDTNSTLSIDWGNRQSYDDSGIVAIDWSLARRRLYDSSSSESLDWMVRTLTKSDGTTISFDWENGILTGQTNVGSSTISATTYLNLPAGFTGAYLPLSGGTVFGDTRFTSGLTANTLTVTGLTQTKGITSTGGIKFPNINIGSTYSATTNDYFINVTGGTFNIYLTSAVGNAGKLYVIKNEGTGIINVISQVGETIDDRTDSLLTQGNSLQIISDGVNWVIIGYNISSTESNTGVISFTGLTKASNTTFTVGPIKGFIVDDTTDPVIPFLTYVEYTGGTHTDSYVTTAFETFVYLTSGGTIGQQTTPLTEQQRRQNIFLGKLGHPDKTAINLVFSQPDHVLSPLAQFRDMFAPINLINGGVYPSTNGANLKFNTSAGYLYGLGINFTTNPLAPSELSISGTSPCTFQYRTQTGGTVTNVTDIDPLNYDVAGLKTAITGTKATNQRIFLLQNGTFRVQYGQNTYNTMALAIEALQTETFTPFPNYINNAVLIGILTVLSTATDLTDTSKAQFFFASKFGETVGAAGGVSTTNLQQAYNNSSSPEITINSTLDGVSIKNGTGNNDNVTILLEGLNSGGTTTSFIRADGMVSGSSLSTNGFTANTNGLTATTVSATTLSTNGFRANTNGLTATTISATTYQNLPTDVRVTGATYSNNTFTYTNNTGGTFNVLFNTVTGLTVNGNLTVTGATSSGTISATTYQNLPTDIRVTGSTYSNNTFTYTNNTGGTFNVLFNTVTGLTVNGNLTVTGNTNVRAFTGTSGTISGTGQNILTVIGSGNSTTSPIFSVQGSSGELFSINDSLVGSLFSVNDISGLPVVEVFSDNTTLWGSYQSPSLNTTTKVTLTAGTNTIYSIPTSGYTGAFYEYTLISTGTTGARAGQIMSIWSGTSANFTETTTTDIGTTTGVTFTVAVSGSNAVLSSSATTAGWTVKTIIRSI